MVVLTKMILLFFVVIGATHTIITVYRESLFTPLMQTLVLVSTLAPFRTVILPACFRLERNKNHQPGCIMVVVVEKTFYVSGIACRQSVLENRWFVPVRFEPMLCGERDKLAHMADSNTDRKNLYIKWEGPSESGT